MASVIEEFITKIVGSIVELRCEKDTITINNELTIRIGRVNDIKRVAILISDKSDPTKCIFALPDDDMLMTMMRSADDYQMINICLTKIRSFYDFLSKYLTCKYIINPLKSLLLDELALQDSNTNSYCPTHLIETLLSSNRFSSAFQSKFHKYFFMQSYVDITSIFAIELFKQDLLKLQGLYIKKVKPSYYTSVYNHGLCSIAAAVTVNEYDKLFIYQLLSPSLDNDRNILFSERMVTLRDKCINYPMIYCFCKVSGDVVEKTIADRMANVLANNDLDWEDIDANYYAVIEYVDGIKLDDVPKQELTSVLQQIKLAVEIANKECSYSPNIHPDNIRCRVLQSTTNISYLLGDKTYWVKSRYLPMILATNLLKDTITDVIELAKRYDITSLDPISTKTPDKGIFFVEEEIDYNEIKLKGLPIVSVVKMPLTITDVLYRYYADSYDLTVTDRSLAKEQARMNKRYVELANYQEIAKLVREKADGSYYDKMCTTILLNRALIRIGFIKEEDKIKLLQLIKQKL